MILQADDDFFLHAFVIKGLIPLANERTVRSFYYVLKGRKSNQTEQDTHMYALFPYYRFFPALTKDFWEEIVHALQNKQFIEIVQPSASNDKETFTVTEAGLALVEEAEAKYSFTQWLYASASTARYKEIELFWKKLHLMSQTISQLLHKNPSFFPIVTDKQVQNWVKHQLRQPEARESWMASFAAELYQLLCQYPANLQRLLINQLSGGSQVGHTLEQLALEVDEPVVLICLKFRYLLFQLVSTLMESEPACYPLLQRMVESSAGHSGLSSSASLTYQLLNQKVDIEQIARRRGLRRGTIEDHLVEIVLHCPDWDHSAYLPPKAKSEIITASQKLGTKRLRLLREYLANRYTYLQIRLALAQVKENA